MLRSFIRLLNSRDGAVAPTIALSLVGLIAVGGVAFDYSRLASMDTELQGAADQAALAAATQLDGQDGAQDRAKAAARDLITNLTYFANDGGGTAVDIPEINIKFYSDYDPDTGAKTGETTDDADSNYVEVTVETRTANYALTPIAAAFSGDAQASAFATLDSAYCNLPPFMMCKPSADFDANDHIGAGMRLIIDNPVAPGNFGFLQTGFGEGANALGMAIGWNGSAGGCVAARGSITEPGNKQSVRPAINTRFDISDGGQSCPADPEGNPRTCSPSTNTRKDLVHDTSCSTNGNGAWQEPDHPYRARNTTPLSASNPMIAGPPARIYPDTMGHPRDLCHAISETGSCTGTANGIVGNGVWDRDAYFKVNYNWTNAEWKSHTGLTDVASASNYATRYKVYLWEAANPLPNGNSGPGIGNNQQIDVVKGKKTEKYYASSWTSDAQGTAPNPQRVCRAPGVRPTDPDQDRRRTSVAVVNCAGLTGRKIREPLQVIDVFLVEPVIKRPELGGGSGNRTGDGDVYVEIIGTRPLPGINQTIGNIVRRDVPRLIE